MVKLAAPLFVPSIVFSLIRVVLAQDFTVPPTWRKPTSDVPRSQRIPLVQGVLDTLTPSFNKTSGLLTSLTITENGDFYAAAANFDFIANATTNRNTVLNGLNTYLAWAPNGGFDGFGNVISDPPLWGIAATNAYRAYGDQTALNYAIAMWNWTYPYFVQPNDAASGKHPKRNVSISGTCNGATTAGGVFALPDPTDTSVNGETIGAFMSLSARLYELTNDTKYQTTAELSAAFIKNQLYNNIIILDTIALGDCSVQTGAVTYNSGFTIDGISVLATKNASWTPFLDQLISTVIPFSIWTNSTSGVIIEGASQPDSEDTMWPKAILTRGLWEAWYRAPAGSAVSNYTEAFLIVQFNALQDLAMAPNSNLYSSQWQGPQATSDDSVAQLSVLDVLNAAVAFAPPPPATSPSSSSSSSSASSYGTPSRTEGYGPGSTGSYDQPPSASNKKSNTGAIAGGVVGGVAGLLIVVGGLFLLCRRRLRETDEDAVRDMMEHAPVPYSVDPIDIGPRSPNEKTAALSPIAASPDVSSMHQFDPYAAVNAIRPSYTHASSSASGPLAEPAAQPVTQPAMPEERSVTADIANVPGLVDTLNRLLQRLPVGGSHGEQPPSYGEN